MTYFDLYYEYLEGCRTFNQQEMPERGWEWHHILPRCLFGDTDPGVWLTKDQHAIASAYQTLAFNTCCVCGWHKKHMSIGLWGLVKPLYRVGYTNRTPEQMREDGRKGSLAQSREHKSRAGKISGARSCAKYWQEQPPEARIENAKRAGAGNKGVGGECRAHGGRATFKVLYYDPDHPELGHRPACILASLQKRAGYPHGSENRIKVNE